MNDTILRVEDVTTEFMKELFEDAYFEVEVDSDGDLKVKEPGRGWCYVIRSNQGPDRIKWLSIWRVSENATIDAKYRYVNKVNAELIGPKAFATEQGSVAFEHYVFLEGGVTRRAIVLMTKRFLAMDAAAVNLDENDVLA